MHALFIQYYPQQPEPPQDGPSPSLFPLNIPMSTAYAQPTPFLTVIAETGQFIEHAPHSMHRSISLMRALLSLIVKTAWGHTVPHMPHPMHLSLSSFNAATPFRYLRPICLLLYTNLNYYMKYEAILIRAPAASAAIIRGSAAFISFSTPDSDVYVDEPVKFIVKKADIEGRINIYEKN